MFKTVIITLTLTVAMLLGVSNIANAGTKAKGDVFDYMNNADYKLFTINTILGSDMGGDVVKMAPVYNIYIFISDNDHVTCHAMLGGKKSKCFRLESK